MWEFKKLEVRNCLFVIYLPLPQGRETETLEYKLKILKREFKHIIEKLTYINNFIFANPQKKEAYAHCSHLLITHADPHPKFAIDCNFPASRNNNTFAPLTNN